MLANQELFIAKSTAAFKVQYLLPIWHWENAPFLEAKKDILLWETRRFIENVAASTKKTCKLSVKSWLRATDLERSVFEYLRPKRFLQDDLFLIILHLPEELTLTRLTLVLSILQDLETDILQVCLVKLLRTEIKFGLKQ